ERNPLRYTGRLRGSPAGVFGGDGRRFSCNGLHKSGTGRTYGSGSLFMARNDFVSVTIVTYNSGRFIKRCLESVLAQKYPAKEVIVIDNASSDGTVDILEQFEDRCKIVYNDENIGFAAAQNQAIESSRGDWVLT